MEKKEFEDIKIEEIEIIDTDFVIQLTGIFVALMIPIMLQIDDYIPAESLLIKVMFRVGYSLLLLTMLIGIFIKISFKKVIKRKKDNIPKKMFVFFLAEVFFFGLFITGLILIFFGLFRHIDILKDYDSTIKGTSEGVLFNITFLTTIVLSIILGAALYWKKYARLWDRLDPYKDEEEPEDMKEKNSKIKLGD